MDAQTLREVMRGNLPNGGYTRLIDGYNAAMVAANITNVKRAAMWAAQLGHESVGLRYMEEIADGSAYEGRRDLGNTYPGDGRRFKGRGPIQLTGRHNYRAFTRWTQAQGHSAIDFEAEPHRVSEPRWGFLAASWYWTVARPQINSLADAGDIVGVTRAINGGTNGLADRRARYARALPFGERLLPSQPAGTPAVTAARVVHPMGEDESLFSETSGFGPRWGTVHRGQDYGAPVGTPIYAPFDGVVVQGAERAPGTVSGFGNWVWIDAQTEHGLDFVVGHMRHNSILVRRGDRVRAGQKIAEVGNEGQSTGPHAHVELWTAPGRIGGAAIDPKKWLDENIEDGELTVADVDRIIAEIHKAKEENREYLVAWLKGFLGPGLSDVKDVRQQLTGGRDMHEYPGWEQAGDRTLMDAVAVIGAYAGVPGFRDVLGVVENSSEDENGGDHRA